MKRFTALSLLVAFSLLTSACGFDRDQHDQKLARGCEAATKSVLPQNYTIEAVKGAAFSFSPTLGNGRNYRVVTLSVSEKADWHVSDKNYQCIFIESLNIAGFGMKSDIYQIKINDQVFGRDDQGNVIGSVNDWLVLTQSVAKELQ